MIAGDHFVLGSKGEGELTSTSIFDIDALWCGVYSKSRHVFLLAIQYSIFECLSLPGILVFGIRPAACHASVCIPSYESR